MSNTQFYGPIEEIMPASPGWFAVSITVEGELFFDPIICWALVNWRGDDGGNVVVGMSAEPGNPELDFAPDSGFLGYSGPHNTLDWNEVARLKREK